jgi:hypothetical protein
VLVLCHLQFVSLFYRPRDFLPDEAHTRSREALIRTLKSVDGDVFMSYAAFLPTSAGKKRYTDGGAFYDIVRHDNAFARRLKASVREAILSRRFKALIVPRRWLEFYDDSPGFAERVEELYRDQGPVRDQWSVFRGKRRSDADADRLFVLRD